MAQRLDELFGQIAVCRQAAKFQEGGFVRDPIHAELDAREGPHRPDIEGSLLRARIAYFVPVLQKRDVEHRPQRIGRVTISLAGFRALRPDDRQRSRPRTLRADLGVEKFRMVALFFVARDSGGSGRVDCLDISDSPHLAGANPDERKS